MERYKHYFDSVESKPLSKKQREAVVTHEDNTRVIAGAGSGKTSVIVAKVGYLLRKGICDEGQILVLAFNKAAAEELSTRIKQRTDAEVKACTFHSLGLNIIAQVEQQKPSLAKSAESPRLHQNLIREILSQMAIDPAHSKAIHNYFQSFFAPYRSWFEFVTLGEYYEYLKAHELVTLQGEKVKSYEETEIANFLHLNGIAYEYERSYEVNTACASHRQYKPDFYLSDHKIYIEHFGINRDGSTPPFMNQAEYAAGMTWKRQIHLENGTCLIETYSYQKKEGVLLAELESRLQAEGVQLQPIDPIELLGKLKDNNRVDDLSRLTATFLQHFKSGSHTIESIRARASQKNLIDGRLDAFLELFSALLERYEAGLKRAGEVDFNDMILHATEHVNSGAFSSPYTCVLVDEFQDISSCRAGLLKALTGQAPSHRLYCVGDDWQAIYRFAGSDIALIRDFQKHFGFVKSVALNQTFRFNDRIEKVASRFVQANPAQIKKTILCKEKSESPRVVIHFPKAESGQVLSKVLDEVDTDVEAGAIADVLILGRNNYLGRELDWPELNRRFPRLKLNFKTVHGAKGLEADYVVILGMRSGKHGFPSEASDDPLLDIVLAEPEGFPHAEERRLFYVALTRARHAVHLIADHSPPSVFIDELMGYEGDVAIIGKPLSQSSACPICKRGTLSQRSGSKGLFYGCSNYPLCDYTVNSCLSCGEGLLVLDLGRQLYVCNNVHCEHFEQICPSCKSGRLIKRNGSHGAFFGCSNFSRGACRYTKSVMSQP